MKEAKALLVMTLVARRSSAWAHDVVTGRPISNGEVSDDAIQRYANDIMDALAILTDPDRGEWAGELVRDEQKATATEAKCKPCKGTGRLEYEVTNHGERNERVRDTCRYCGGTGRVSEQSTGSK